MGGGDAPGIPFGDDEGLCETASSWRLLCWRGFHLGLAHRPYSTTSEEPPLQNSTARGTSSHPRAIQMLWRASGVQ